MEPYQVPMALQKAFHLMRSGRPGPVLVDLPIDVQLAEIEFDIDAYEPLVPFKPVMTRKQAEKALTERQESIELAQCYDAVGQPERAEEIYKAARKAKPNDVPTLRSAATPGGVMFARPWAKILEWDCPYACWDRWRWPARPDNAYDCPGPGNARSSPCSRCVRPGWCRRPTWSTGCGAPTRRRPR